MQVALHAGLQLLVLGALKLAFGNGFSWTLVWLLVTIPWVIVLMLAGAFFIASISCYLRDLQHLIPLAMSGLMFLSPVFYPQAAAPEALRALLVLNPLSAPIEALRAACFGDAFGWPDAAGPMVFAVLALVVARGLFARLRPGFADLV
jgi:lipopolysaccharide transport system permease protein